MDSEKKPGEGSIFQATNFEGKVSAGSFEHPLTFVVRAGDDCRLEIDPLMVPGKTYVALSKLMGEPGGHGEAITLEGSSSDGVKFFSPHMEIRGASSGTNGYQIRLGTGEASITHPRENNSKGSAAGLRLWLRGFKSFRPSPVQAQLGKVFVQGAHKVMSADDVSGSICVQCADNRPDESWYQDAESLADFVWSGLQFGHGGRLQVPLIQEYRPNEKIATFYNGSGRPAHLPAVHFLDQSEFIAALVARFESVDPFPKAVWQAVGWLNNDSSIDEVRYLTPMTAIETILHSLVPDAPSTLLPKEKFRPIRTALIQALAASGLSHDEEEVLASNIKQINRAPLSQKLKAVIEKYDLSSGVFDENLIRRLNKQRVSIVHRGHSLEGDDLWECMLYARELIALIVFSELGYKGRYQSYAEGHEQRTMS